MSARKLKHYKDYRSRLILFANAMGVAVVFDDIDCDGIWMPYKREIKIDDGLSNSIEIASLLHEIGHSVDDLACTSISAQNQLHDAYSFIYSDKYSKKQHKSVLMCEKRAWTIGRYIAARLNIKLGKWYTDHEKDCLKNYRGT